MLYPFMTLDDNTEIVHSESYLEDGKEHVRVEIEKPVPGGFHSAQCILPEYTWREINGFTESEIQNYQNLMSHTAVLSNDKDIVKFAFRNIVIRYKGPYSLQYFSKVNKYENGYIEVMCKFQHDNELIEDYIDMEDIASELYMDTSFLKDVNEVRCEHA